MSIPSFSKIRDFDDLKKKAFTSYNITVFAQPVDDNFSLTEETETAICGRIAPGLAYAARSIRPRNEKSRYFFVFAIIEEFIRIGDGYQEVNKSTGKNPVRLEVVSEGEISDGENEALPVNGSSRLYLEHEPYVGEAGETSKGMIEFVLFDGPEEDSKIRAVIEVKKSLSLPNAHNPAPDLCQLYAELLASVHRNWKIDPTYTENVWGALSDGYTWIFCRARRDPNNVSLSFIIETDTAPYTLFGSASLFGGSSSDSTLKCVGQIFHGLFPHIEAISGEEVLESLSKIDQLMGEEAEEFLRLALKHKRDTRALKEAALEEEKKRSEEALAELEEEKKRSKEALEDEKKRSEEALAELEEEKKRSEEALEEEKKRSEALRTEMEALRAEMEALRAK